MNSSIFTNFRNKGQKFVQIKKLVQCYSTEADPIVIPKRIRRSPTDILKALANTVQNDPTAAHYKYHDDPYLIPYSNSSKRSYALSQEAGRKAAHWIRQQHADLFQHKVADPPIEAFVPKPVIDENSEVDEGLLKKLILNNSVSDAIAVYQLLEGNSVELSRTTKQSLLELICYYNSTDPLQEDWIEERWFRQVNKLREMPKNTWIDNGIAERIFNQMKPADSKSYSALITGMCTHGQVDKALKYYQESVENGIMLNVTTFNALLAKVNFMKENHELMWAQLEELMNAMNQRGLKPNVQTLNAILESLSLMSSNHNSKNNALRVLAEFKQLNIEPSLSSYYHLLNIFCQKRGSVNGILIDIMDHIQGKTFKPVDLKDTSFFVKAMDVCNNHLQDKELAYRVHKLLHTADNYNLIGDSFRESVYYRSFFTLLCKTEPIDVFMDFYDTLVPNIYVPEPSVMQDILSIVKQNGSWEYLPHLWSDMVQFDLTDREVLLADVLDCASKNMDDSMYSTMTTIGWNVWEKIENQTRERNLITWTGSMLGNLMMIFIQGGEKAKAVMVLDKLYSLQNQIIGEPNILPLQLLLDACIEDSSVKTALKCIKYCHEIGFLEVDDMARKLHSCIALPEKELEELVKIVGRETLERSTTEKQKH